MKKKYYDKIRLGFGQSLIIGSRPEKLTLAHIGVDKPGLEINRFGLFESATPNFHTYYPDVKPEDLKPVEGDFVKPIFRALSEVIVRKRSQPLDFSMNGVLKDSMNKLLGQTIYANHEALVGNDIGAVSDVSWQNSYTTSNGVKVPAGINAEFKIDAKSHPKIARAIMMEPPAIHSNSVTVEFGWEQSHPAMERQDFMGKMGSLGADGQLIRRVATEIRNYHETSLVAHGADPFAQRIGKDGKINNAEYADSVYSLSMQGKEEPKIFFFSYKEDTIDKTSLEEDGAIPEEPNINTEEKMKKEFITAMALKFKVAEDQITEKFLEDKLTAADTAAAELTTSQTALTAEKAEVTRLKGELAAEKTSVTALTTERDALKVIAEPAQKDLLSETKRVYSLLKGDKADAAKLALLEKTDFTALKVELKGFNEELETKFPASCKDCGSHNVARNTASVEVPKTEVEGGAAGGEKTDAQLNEELRNENKTGYIFDKK